MSKLILFKRVIFWLEVAVTLLLLCVGVVLTVSLLSGAPSILDALTGLASFAWYLFKIAIKSISNFEFESVILLVGCAIFSGSLLYFSQTERERKIVRYIIPAFVLAIIFFAIGAVGHVMAGLGGQGAGR
ncbi:MAG: hypothetical protein H8E21_09140 [Gammaproteobacteria bacterium]|nr:hypothetical protein [Gammaproteobacteria bacterium]